MIIGAIEIAGFVIKALVPNTMEDSGCLQKIWGNIFANITPGYNIRKIDSFAALVKTINFKLYCALLTDDYTV